MKSMIRYARSFRQVGVALFIGIIFPFLSGCVAERIRGDAQEKIRAGQYETAMDELEHGLVEDPESTILRSGTRQAKTEILSRLIAEAAGARAVGRYEEAEALLSRAKRFDTDGQRVGTLLADVSIERRQRAALSTAQFMVEAGKKTAAIQLISEALKDNPRNPDLTALKRRLESDVRQAQVSALQQGLLESRPISLDFRDASLKTVLDVVSRNSGINFVLDKDIRVDARVTVFLKSARVEDAIDLITSTNGLSKKILDGKTLLIYPNTPEKQKEHQEQVIRVFHLASADAKGAAAFLRAMLRIREPFVDERGNMLAIRESPENITLAERLIDLYDTPEPEVLLELEVIEVRTTRLLELGLKFPDTLSLSPLGPDGGAGGLTWANLKNFGRDQIGISVGGLLFNFKRQVGDFNTLANPKIRAKNKEKAKIMVGDKVPVVTTTTGVGGFVSDSVSYLDVGLKLDVEPTVYPDDEVAIRIGLEVSSVSREVKTNNGTLAYQIGTRNASTMLRLRDGETQLLAGLINNEDRSSASRIPGLGDLPIAGRLFSNQSDDWQRTELVLAVTPHIIRNLQRPDASQAELWVGTESVTRLRSVGGRPGVADTMSDSTTVSPPVAGGPSSAARISGVAEQVAQSRATLRIRGPAVVKQGEEFEIELMLDTPVPLRGLPIELAFVPGQLSISNVQEGEFFGQGGVLTSFTHKVDDAKGSISVGVLRQPLSGQKGNGVIAKLKVRALGKGAVDLNAIRFDGMVMEGGQLPKFEAFPYRVIVN
ncbi:MAG TPA: secretin and TonB N-terminal domain-containing protein [Ideonella sp.]|uniref:secretin and TonB N-terminal domain-containing protein n=1 Tax=Ideonella sp. TaxID=1929293 RepID=UPI002D18AB0D|nr:secretin and TonB N-terminal domain-containing protein [Ideonella sp.]HSI48014.1 secretin and TonB N-terminal domain-containing protein [Ideonella sp.]